MPALLTRPRPTLVPRPIRWLLAVDLALGVAAVANAVIAEGLGVERADFFRSGVEANLPTWYAVVQLALVGFILLPLAVRDLRPQRPSTWGLALGPALFLLLSLDEGAMVHERLGLWLTSVGASTDTFGETSPWLFVLAPLYGVVALGAFRSWRPYLRGRSGTGALLFSGALLLGACAAGMEALLFLLDAQHATLGQAMSVVEETGELVAVTLILWGALRLVHAEGIRLEWGSSPPGQVDHSE